MADDSWVDTEVAAAGPCPSCCARAAVPIVYGMPDSSYDRLQDRVEFAGCLVPEEPERFRRGRCGARWGRYERAPEELGSPFDGLLE